MERPLQISFFPKDADRVEAMKADKGWEKWSGEDRELFLQALESFSSERVPSRKTFKKQLRAMGFKPAATQMKLIQKHLAEHDGEAEICRDSKGNPESDSDLRDYENVPLKEDVRAYFEREVLPHVPAAWIDEGKTDEKDGKVGIVGYEIPFNRHFYEYVPPRPLEEIDADLAKVSGEIMELLTELSGV